MTPFEPRSRLSPNARARIACVYGDALAEGSFFAMLTTALSATSSSAGAAESFIDVLGATATACEDASLPAENRIRLRTLRMSMLQRVARLCTSALASGVRLSVIVNVFSGGDTCDMGELPSCVLNVTKVPGSKLSFWTEVLVPELTQAFNLVWCFDNDMAVDRFALHVAARTAIAADASMVQPCISARLRNGNQTGQQLATRTTDIPHLRCHRMCSGPMPARGDVRFGGVKCLMKQAFFIEVMTPIFAARAWALQHRRILSRIPKAMMLESDRGLGEVWCKFFKSERPDKPACGLLCLSIAHLHGRTIDVSNHSHIRYGKAGVPQLIRWSHTEMRQYYVKSAAGWPPGKCVLPVNKTRGALAAALPSVNASVPASTRPCGAGCQRRNRLSGW